MSLVTYSDSEEESCDDVTKDDDITKDNDVTKENDVTKRKLLVESEDDGEAKRKKNSQNGGGRLPSVPLGIQQMYGDKSIDDVIDSSDHSGRVRSFAHERGNWATYVHVPFEADEEFREFVDELLEMIPECETHAMEEFHISLSHTFVIRHHWIKPLVSSLRKKLASHDSTYITMDAVNCYTNDEKTRSFLSLGVTVGHDMLCKMVHTVDSALVEYNLREYYKEPSLHMSIAWSLGESLNKLTPEIKINLQEKLDEFIGENPEVLTFNVTELKCKTGNKYFNFPLGAK